MRLRTSASSVAIAFVMSTLSALAANPSETIAVAAAQKWLGTVDKGAYTTSWQDAAGYLKSNVTQDRFAQQLTNVRKPLGKLVSRKLLSKKYTTSAPGAPDGKYVVIQFKTSFSEKKSAVETIIPALEKDGQWRVTGYWIK
jgi:hypothetical protein